MQQSQQQQVKRRRVDEVYIVQPVEIKPPQINFLFQSAKTPQELVYSILLDQRATFSKSELLQVVEKIINLFEEDQFKGECSYIG